MHANHGVPLFLSHVDDGAVAQNAGVVDQDVQPAKLLDGRSHQALGTCPIGHVVGIGHGLPAHGLDLVDHRLRRPRPSALPIARAAQVIDHHLGALARELQRVGPPDAAPCARHDCHQTFAHACHGTVSCSA